MIKEKIKKEMKKVVTVIDRKYYCDKCGNEIKRDSYSKDSFRVKFDTGYWYPEGGTIEREHAFFCEECSVVVKKLLEDNGVKFEKIEID